MLRHLATLTLAGLWATTPALAGDETDQKVLTIGDQAPKIQVDHWVKGDAVKAYEEGNVYVLDFWATWCGPCRASVPHITDMQARYKDYDVHFLGISSEKQLPTVVGFLAERDSEGASWWDKMGYGIGVDPDRSVSNDYMTAASQFYIPTAFIVGKTGKIEWIGSPREIDEPLRAVVDDDWDRQAYKVEFEPRRIAAAEAHAAQLEMRAARQAGDWETVVGLLDRGLAKNPEDLNLLMQKFDILLAEMGHADAYAVGAKIVEMGWDNAQLLNGVAWTVADNPKVKHRDFGFALKAVDRANELTGGKDGAILDTMARVYYEQGNIEKAIKIQRKAVELTPEGPMRKGIVEALERYERESK